MNTRATTIGATMIALTFTGMAAVQAADTAAPVSRFFGIDHFAHLARPDESRGQVRGAVRHVGGFARKRCRARDRVADRVSGNAHVHVDSGRRHGDDHDRHDHAAHEADGLGQRLHSLALAQFALNQNGITNPTGAQLQAALNGGTFKTADGTTVTLAGVLQQRSDGMGWGRIAQSYGMTMGAVNRGIKAPITTVATATPATPVKTVSTATAPKVTTGRGVSSASGLTTASGTAASAGHGTKGLTTAASTSGSANSGGIVTANASAHGNGYAYGHGVMTASGSSAGASAGASSGMVTGAGGAAGVITADPNHGAGSVNSHGKGKGGG